MAYQIKNYMTKDIPTINVENTAVEASKMMKDKEVGYLIALDQSKPKGIVTERDLVSKVLAQEIEPSKIKVSEIMSTPLITIDPDATVEEAVKIMANKGIRRLPVVRGEIIYGMFTSRDLAKNFDEYSDRVTRDIVRSMSLVSLPF